MKSLTFAEMLAMPEGTIFLRDSADDDALYVKARGDEEGFSYGILAGMARGDGNADSWFMEADREAAGCKFSAFGPDDLDRIAIVISPPILAEAIRQLVMVRNAFARNHSVVIVPGPSLGGVGEVVGRYEVLTGAGRPDLSPEIKS